jgi:TIR domain
MAAKVFLCYRRDDSAGYAGRVQDRLAQEFGRDLLFMDVDTIPLGVNFATVLRNEVAKCEVLLAVIGPHWLDARDEAGTRRLDDPHDFVRIEIGAALQRNIPVIPILLDGAKVPKGNELPKDLEELSMRNGLDVRHASFHNDIDRLVRGLKVQLAEADAEERRRDEDERRKQEAENRRRLEEAKAKERRRDEERKREEEPKLAAKEAGRQIRPEQEPAQQPVKPWLLPLIGAVVAALPMVVLYGILKNSSNPPRDAWVALVLSIIYALYGGAAGMLVPRFGIPRAVALPAIPAFLLGLVFLGFAESWETFLIPLTGATFVPAYFLTWLAFWLHARWVRKQRMIESGLIPP